MNQYSMLLKNKLMDFTRVMIDNYYLLDLNETDAMIIIKLNDLLSKQEASLDVSLIAPIMKLSKEEISLRIVSLVQRGFIVMELSKVDGAETFNLDGTYNQLGIILNQKIVEKENESSNLQLKEIIKLIETEFKKVVTPIELEMIKNWFQKDEFTFEEIEAAVLECLKMKKRNIQYIDIILNRKKEEQKEPVKSDVKELFNSIYGKIK